MTLRGVAWAGAVLAVVVATAGCTEDPAPLPTRTSSAPTPTTPTTTEPTVAPPSLAPEATEPTASGAEAFVSYWIAALNYAYETGDVGPVEAASAPACDVCSTTIERIESVYGSGGEIRGSQMRASSIASPAPDITNLVSVAVTFTQEAGESVGVAGEVEQVPPVAATSVGFVMVHDGGGWLLQGIGTT